MTTDLSTFKGNALVSSDLFKKLMGLNKSLSGGGDSRRISIRGGRFREIIGGEQVRVNSSGSMNIVVLSASPIGRTYYEGTYDTENPTPPVCWSQDGEKPAPEVAADKRKSDQCRTCPMNVKGSGQGNSRACRFSARLAVALEGQYDKVYQLSIPATSLFGAANNGNMPMQAYAKFLTANETPMLAVVTQMYFDEDSETPKLFFRPVRPLDEAELTQAIELAEHEDVERAITLTVSQRDEEGGAPAAAKAAKPAAAAAKEPTPTQEPEAEEPVAEPKKTEAKPAAQAPADLGGVLSAWDD